MGWTYTALTEKSEAKLIEITTDDGSLVFVNGTSSSSKTLSVVAEGFTPYSFKWEKKNSDGTYTQVGTARTYIVAGVANVGTYRATAYEDANDNVGHSDMVTIASVSDGQGGSSPYLFSLSNENFTINTDNSLKPTSALNYDITITGYHGSALMTPVAPSATLASGQYKVACSSNLFTLQNDNKTLRFTTDTATALASANQSFTVTVSYYNDSTSSVQTEEKIITVSASKNGSDGHSPVVTATKASGATTTIIKVDGVEQATINDGSKGDSITISSTEVKYQASTSNTTVPTGTWNTAIPSVAAGSYLWTRTIITYSDNTSVTSYSVARQGINGADSTVAGPRAIRYLGKSSTVGSGVTNKDPTDLGTTIDGDWFLNTNDGYVYYRTGTNAWSKLTCTSGTPDYRIVAAIEDLIVLSTTIPTNTTLNYVVDKYVECIIAGTAFVEKLFANTANVNELVIKDLILKNDGAAINISLGRLCLDSRLFNGSNNVAIGNNILRVLEDGANNIGIGSNILVMTEHGKQNIAIGKNAAYGTTGDANIAIGNYALGNSSGQSDCDSNVAIGTSCGNKITTGGYNILIGGNAGASITTGNDNIFLGYETGNTNDSKVITGDRNVIIGVPYKALNIPTDCSNFTYINDAIKHYQGILYSANSSGTFKEVLTTGSVGSLESGSSDVTDGTEFVSSYASDNGFSDTNAVNKPYKRQFVKVWNYIKGKISSILGLTATNYGGKASTAGTADNAITLNGHPYSDFATGNSNIQQIDITPRQFNTPSELTSIVANAPYGLIIFTINWNEYQSFPYAGCTGIIFKSGGSSHTFGLLRTSWDTSYFGKCFWWVDVIEVNRYSGIQDFISQYATTAYKIRTSAPSSPENGDIWIE